MRYLLRLGTMSDGSFSLNAAKNQADNASELLQYSASLHCIIKYSTFIYIYIGKKMFLKILIKRKHLLLLLRHHARLLIIPNALFKEIGFAL